MDAIRRKLPCDGFQKTYITVYKHGLNAILPSRSTLRLAMIISPGKNQNILQRNFYNGNLKCLG